jgi:membrane protein DedA with SNARE-associated domain
MLSTLAFYIAKYGLIIVFSLIFLQEVGIPSPLPNEVLLLFAGFLASTGKLQLIPLIIVAVAGDFIGSSVLYGLFYYFGSKLLAKHPKWISPAKVEHWRKRLSGKHLWSIYVGRLLPYARAYTSMAAGTLKIRPIIFESSVLLSAITWSGGYVILGRVLGSAWSVWAAKLGFVRSGIGVLLGVSILSFVSFRLYKKYGTG